MINVQKYTPEVYYNNSRDFQAIGRICEVLYNYILMNADNMLGLPISDNTNPVLLDLALLTIGFDRHHNYTNVDLVKLAEIFKYVMRIKGTKKAIEEVIFLLLRSQNIEEEAFVLDIHSLTGTLRDRDWSPDIQHPNDMFSIDLYVSNKLKDVVLIEDMFDYILPAGFIYHIYLSSTFKREATTISTTHIELLNCGNGYSSNSVFGQVTNTKTYKDEDSDPIIDLPSTSRTFTLEVVGNGDIELNSDSGDTDNEWKYPSESQGEENNG